MRSGGGPGAAVRESCSPPPRLVALTALCALATLVTPYHVRIYLVVLEYATQPGPFRFVNELKAVEFRAIPGWGMLGLAAAATFALGRRRRLCSFEVILLAVAAFFAFRARRDLWFLVIAALAVLTTQCQREVEASTHFAFSWRRAGFVVAALALLVPTVWQAPRLAPRRPPHSLAALFPAAALPV